MKRFDHKKYGTIVQAYRIKPSDEPEDDVDGGLETDATDRLDRAKGILQYAEKDMHEFRLPRKEKVHWFKKRKLLGHFVNQEM